MNLFKRLYNKYFQFFAYFYYHLGYRVFVALGLSLIVGILDGFGLAMFLPLLQMLDGSNHADSSKLGHLSFLLQGFEKFGLPINLYSVLIIIMFFFVFKGIVKFFEGYYRIIYQQYFIKKIRIENTELLASYSYEAFVNSDSGRIQNTFTGEVERVNQSYRAYFLAIQAGVLVVVYVFLAFLTNPNFATLVVIGGFLTNLFFKKLYSDTKKLSKQATEKAHAFHGLLIQNITNFKYLKATGLIYQYVKKLKTNIVEIEHLQRRMGVLSALLQSVREPIIMVVVVLVILLQVVYFGVSLTLIVLSLMFFYRAMTFLMTVQNQWNTFLSVSGSLGNMTDFTLELRGGQESNGITAIKNFDKEVVFENVSFAYGDNIVLEDISLVIPSKETIAFIGESGSGKTTLVNMIVGLFPPKSGKLSVDGINYNALDMHQFQNRIGYITQEPVIFNDTIFNNVTFWDEKNEINLLKFKEAIRKAAISEFVESLDFNEDSKLGNNGINLSGGQRQRISIARELYKDIDILVMDEATSALDSETEKSIQENIDLLKGQYTIVIIAHRLSTIKKADRVILLDKGRIMEEGTFDALQQKSKTFKRMVSLQNFND